MLLLEYIHLHNLQRTVIFVIQYFIHCLSYWIIIIFISNKHFVKRKAVNHPFLTI